MGQPKASLADQPSVGNFSGDAVLTKPFSAATDTRPAIESSKDHGIIEQTRPSVATEQTQPQKGPTGDIATQQKSDAATTQK